MAKKSDKWIKRRSSLKSFGATVIGMGEAPLGSVSLGEILDSGMDINFLSQALAQSDLLFFDTWSHEPSILALHAQMKKRFGPDVSALRFTIDVWATTGNFEYQVPLPLVYPFFDRSISTLEFRGKTGKCPSYGLTSYGYDIRLGNKFKICQGRKSPGKQNLLDFLTCEDTPSEDHLYKDLEAEAIDLLPGQFMLGVSMEWINMPNDTIATCMQKSSLARKGCMAFVTPLEPGWRGYITLEIVNHTEVTQRLYAGMGIMQLNFEEGDERCEVSYADRGGKYMNQQAAPVLSKMS